jgi:hypothetical protein
MSSLAPFFLSLVLYSALPFMLFEDQPHEPGMQRPGPPPPPHLESVVVTFPPDTPREFVEDCIAFVRVRGGEVGFVYCELIPFFTVGGKREWSVAGLEWNVLTVWIATMNGFTATADVEVLDYVSAIASEQHINIEMVKDKDKGVAESE